MALASPFSIIDPTYYLSKIHKMKGKTMSSPATHFYWLLLFILIILAYYLFKIHKMKGKLCPVLQPIFIGSGYGHIQYLKTYINIKHFPGFIKRQQNSLHQLRKLNYDFTLKGDISFVPERL